MSATAISPETTTVSTALTVNGTQRPLQELFPNLFETLVDEDTGEETLEPKIVYIEGRPKIYRFDGKTGRFNLDGKEDLGTDFTFQPFAWRLFNGGLFDRKESTQWVEFFFLDADLCVSTIMFNNTSAINFKEAREKIAQTLQDELDRYPEKIPAAYGLAFTRKATSTRYDYSATPDYKRLKDDVALIEQYAQKAEKSKTPVQLYDEDGTFRFTIHPANKIQKFGYSREIVD